MCYKYACKAKALLGSQQKHRKHLHVEAKLEEYILKEYENTCKDMLAKGDENQGEEFK